MSRVFESDSHLTVCPRAKINFDLKLPAWTSIPNFIQMRSAVSDMVHSKREMLPPCYTFSV
jgi:hypothetical protein